MLGQNNSVTDKIYGEDTKTGYKWGVVTAENDKEEPQFDDGVYTTYQWAHERDVNDGLDKTASFRYAHNQLENGITTRYVKYSFELEAGEYELEVCMGNIWGNFDKAVTWKSSKKAVVSVSSKGKIAAKKAGTATITAISKADKKRYAKLTINVSKNAKKNTTLKISPTKKNLKPGKSLNINIKDITQNTTDKITYKSSNKSVATVDAYGKVNAKKKGKATITVKCGKKSAKLQLTVRK